jgi:hypothetical protein
MSHVRKEALRIVSALRAFSVFPILALDIGQLFANCIRSIEGPFALLRDHLDGCLPLDYGIQVPFLNSCELSFDGLDLS